ncbi:pentatricopeptide repeat-containing protein At1g08070, chloroplastic-like [Juglans microcarpa x Juglans regia]|uniref:pentatricopeptide repeat-containing protein At1g08070, chloroplastic-like n=1 Tax=Juglans microcarpa x Juglans regia TaxID=2249226 RepID=UPI001B7E3E16|nr:pentatricopeptide repeat-containing protein At1g08070, chloroplastic-like [Juglans microcarpa x Juglans regia]
MKIAPDHIILGALCACKIYGNIEIGEAVAKILVDCGYADSGTYIPSSSVYAFSGRWNELAEVRAKMVEGGMLKELGCSSIEVNNEIHEFLLGDIIHVEREQIFKKLEELNHALKLEGYLSTTQMVMQGVEDGQNEWALAIHSERLAICYGLISTTTYPTLRIGKNLRVCNDGHSMHQVCV